MVWYFNTYRLVYFNFAKHILSKHSKLKINTGVNHEKIYQLFNSFFTGMVLRCMELFRFYLRKNGNI